MASRRPGRGCTMRLAAGAARLAADLPARGRRRAARTHPALVIWYLIEHDLRHGGEIRLTPGMHGPPVPELAHVGPANCSEEAIMEPAPFTIHIPDETLADLYARLDRVRWPDEIPSAGWQYGADLTYLRPLVEYWRTQYDWRLHEAHLNAFGQFTMRLS